MSAQPGVGCHSWLSTSRGYLDRRAGHSYTTDPHLALPGEGEPVDEETQQRISDDARRRFEQERADELARRNAKTYAGARPSRSLSAPDFDHA